MAGDDEYELLPKEELDTLKKEIERLKRSPFGEMKEGETLLDAINNLNANIRKLIEIFTNAQAELESHYAEGGAPVEDLKDIKDQNEQIAQGILAIADMVKETKSKVESQPPPELSHQPRIPIGRPDTYGGGIGGIEPPSPEPFPDDIGSNIPPPPPTSGSGGMPPFDDRMPEPRRRGLFRK
ncbi:hypothetical protein JXB28_04720 [Candidatus Woesearchaeota archaeon]|nr:hypothetical protein [Candidatus Woesearchaeota archaeon]